LDWVLVEVEELEDLLEDDLLVLVELMLVEERLELLLDDLLVLVELEDVGTVVRGTEHSFTPPEIRLPKVASEQVKLPDKTLKTNLSARPKATVVDAATEQVLPSLHKVL
jgi:hypothetical protein